jgi:glycosyltransferase involved in cell wall biosynthesis
MPFGLNYAGYFSSVSGLGQAARNTVQALDTASIPYVLHNIEGNPSPKFDPPLPLSPLDVQPYDFNLIHINPDGFARIQKAVGETYFEKKTTIALWTWEVDPFPQRWHRLFASVDAVWTPSTYVQEILIDVSPVPVSVVPHPVIVDPDPAANRSSFALPEDHFLFCTSVDTLSSIERKNPLGVIQAFQKAFRISDPVTLVLKCLNTDSAPRKSPLQELYDAAKDVPNIRVIDETLSTQALHSLIACCDCFVSLHRAEGFGLMLAEALALDTPVIATNFSGNLDFMNEGNSFLVNAVSTSPTRHAAPYAPKGVWAEPDLHHAAEYMRHVYEHPQAARERAQCGAAHIRYIFSPESVGQQITQQVQQLAAVRISDVAKSPKPGRARTVVFRKAPAHIDRAPSLL